MRTVFQVRRTARPTTWIDFVICDSCHHTCQVLRFRRSHYAFLEKLKTTAIVRNDYGFTLGWDVFFGNHLIMFGLFLDELMGLSQYR